MHRNRQLRVGLRRRSFRDQIAEDLDGLLRSDQDGQHDAACDCGSVRPYADSVDGEHDVRGRAGSDHEREGPLLSACQIGGRLQRNLDRSDDLERGASCVAPAEGALVGFAMLTRSRRRAVACSR